MECYCSKKKLSIAFFVFVLLASFFASSLAPPVHAQDTIYHTVYLWKGQMRVGGGSTDTLNMSVTATVTYVSGTTPILYAAVGLRVTAPDGSYFFPASTAVILAPGGSVAVALTWNGSDPGPVDGSPIGVTYTLSAEVDPINAIANETDGFSTVLSLGNVTFWTLTGDINGDGVVDIYDAILLAAAYGSHGFQPGVLASPNWNPDCDLNGDGVVDIYDAILLAANFGLSVTTA